MNLIILYPTLFNSYSKFERKLNNILKNSSIENVSFINDWHFFIKKYFETKECDLYLKKESKIDAGKITHAIIFDDGEEFFHEYKQLQQSSIVTRRIKIKITRVINIRRDLDYQNIKSNSTYEYIGRNSYWGNPYSTTESGHHRDEVIRKFKYDFDFDKFPHIKKDDVYKLAGKRLGCFCKPANCHGDVLANYLNEWDDGE